MRRAARQARIGRIEGWIEDAAGLVRLLAWAAMIGGYGLTLWALSGSAYAEERAQAAPRASAFVADDSQGKAARRHPEHAEARP